MLKWGQAWLQSILYEGLYLKGTFSLSLKISNSSRFLFKKDKTQQQQQKPTRTIHSNNNNNNNNKKHQKTHNPTTLVPVSVSKQYKFKHSIVS